MATLMKKEVVDLSCGKISKNSHREDMLTLCQGRISDMLYGTLMDVELQYRALYQKQHKAEVLINKNSHSICESVWKAFEPHIKNIIKDCPDANLKHLHFYLSVDLEDNGRYIVTFHDRSFDSPKRLPYSDQTVELTIGAKKAMYYVYHITDINNTKREFVVYDDEDESAGFEKPNGFVYRDNTAGIEEHIVYASARLQKSLQVNLDLEGEVKVGEVKIVSDND